MRRSTTRPRSSSTRPERDRGPGSRRRDRRHGDRPTGPLVDLADNVAERRRRDRRPQRPPGARAPVERGPRDRDRGKGLRFTRIWLVLDPGKEGVVYMTADFHKPWTIGADPRSAIQAKIDELNAQLAPILGTEIGDSTRRSRAPISAAAGTGGCASRSSATSSRTRCARPTADRRPVRDHELGRAWADLTCPTTDMPGTSARRTRRRRT